MKKRIVSLVALLALFVCAAVPAFATEPFSPKYISSYINFLDFQNNSVNYWRGFVELADGSYQYPSVKDNTSTIAYPYFTISNPPLSVKGTGIFFNNLNGSYYLKANQFYCIRYCSALEDSSGGGVTPSINPLSLFSDAYQSSINTMTKIAHDAKRRGKKVFANVPLPGCYLIEDKDIGFKMLPPNSVLLVDEVGMIWDNRHFKDFKPEVRDWFKLQRHYRVKVYLFSQTFDIDKKLRDLTDDMFLIEKKFRIFAYGKRILKKCVLTEASADQPSRIDENLKFDSILFFWAGSRTLTLIPRWAKSFDSFAAPALPVKHWPLDEQEFQPVPYRVVFHTLAANFAHVVGADRLAHWFWKTKDRADEEVDLAPEEIDFDEFFSHRPDSEG